MVNFTHSLIADDSFDLNIDDRIFDIIFIIKLNLKIIIKNVLLNFIQNARKWLLDIRQPRHSFSSTFSGGVNILSLPLFYNCKIQSFHMRFFFGDREVFNRFLFKSVLWRKEGRKERLEELLDKNARLATRTACARAARQRV